MFSMLVLVALNTDADARPCPGGNCPPARDLQRVLDSPQSRRLPPRTRPMPRPQNIGHIETDSSGDATDTVADPETSTDTEPEAETNTDAETVDSSAADVEYVPPTHAVTDGYALARDPDDDYASTGDLVPVGTGVNILQRDGDYVEVSEVLPEGFSGPSRTWWTAESNLGSPKEFDQDLVPDRLIDLTGLTGLDRTMAIIYNTKGLFIEEEAERLGIDASALAGVLKVEARGVGFNDDGTPIIRFENHHFARYWGNDSDENRSVFDQHFQYSSNRTWEGHRFRESTSDPWMSFHGDQHKEYQVLSFAREISDEDGLLSISMGAGQVLGSNHDMLGYDNAREMFDDLSTGIEPQLDGMVAYIENCGTCMTGLRADNYTTFASGYNGSGQAATYGALIEDAAESYERILRLVPPPENN